MFLTQGHAFFVSL